MTQRNQFTFYRSYYDAVLNVPKRQQANILLAIVEYAFTGIAPTMSGSEQMAFALVKPTLDSARNKSESIRKRSNKRPNDLESLQEERPGNPPANPEQFTPSLIEEEKEKEKEIELEKEKEIELEKESYSPHTPPLRGGEQITSGKGQGPGFCPPTAGQVQDYCRERGNRVDAQAFVDFYSSKGWMIGKNKMKDWRAAVRTWERQDRERGIKTQNYTTGNPFFDMLAEEPDASEADD